MSLAEAIKRHSVPGAVLAVLDGETLHESAAGVVNVRTGVEATPDAVFQIGSVTKLFTATLVMQLADQGELELDAPVRRHLPELALDDPEAAALVTVRQLLTHTSGIDGDFFVSTGSGEDCLERFVLACSALPQLHPPGRLWSYCNAGFALLGRIVEKLTGLVWDEALRVRLAKPLGAEGVQSLPEEMLRYRVAHGHFVSPADGKAQLAPPWRGMRSNGPAGTTTVAMARDLVRFARMHVAGGLTQGGTRLLSESAVREMQKRHVTLPPFDAAAAQGLGWMHFDGAGTPMIGHDGGTIGQFSFLRVLPERKLAVALLANGGDAFGFSREVLGDVLGRLAGVSLPEVPEPDPAAPRDDSLYAGRWERRAAALEIARDGGRLILHQHWRHAALPGAPDAPPLPLEVIRPDALLLRVPPSGAKVPVVFLEPDASGRPTYLQLGGRLHRRVA